MNREQLTANLDPGVAAATLSACELADKDEYTEEECGRFNQARILIEQGKTYEEVVTYFKEHSGQPESNSRKRASKGKKVSTMPRSQMLAISSEQCGTRVSLLKAGQLLEACGLPDQEEYSETEATRFLEACDLHLRMGQSLTEVAAHFGMPTDSPTEILQLLEQMSDEQLEELKASLIQAKTEQTQQIIAAFHRLTIQKLRQKAETGELQAELQQAWTRCSGGNGFNLLAQVEARSQTPKHLPGS